MSRPTVPKTLRVLSAAVGAVALASSLVGVTPGVAWAHRAPSTLGPGHILRDGNKLVNKPYVLYMQPDGNLVEYDRGYPIWSTGTAGEPGNHLYMQTDGNLVLYNHFGQPVWQTDTWGYGNADVTLQTDGNIVVYWWNAPLWAAWWETSQGGAQLYAQRLFAHWGWNVSSQFPYLNDVWTHESNWEWYVCSGGGVYPYCDYTGIAYGIPQADPGDMMASAGPDWATDGLTQVQWGLNYIASRYGSPYGAWLHEQDYGWYVRPRRSGA